MIRVATDYHRRAQRELRDQFITERNAQEMQARRYAQIQEEEEQHCRRMNNNRPCREYRESNEFRKDKDDEEEGGSRHHRSSGHSGQRSTSHARSSHRNESKSSRSDRSRSTKGNRDDTEVPRNEAADAEVGEACLTLAQMEIASTQDESPVQEVEPQQY